MSKIFDLKKEIVTISQKAYANKLIVGTSGNLSAYVPEEKKMLITPTCVRYDTMTADDIVVMTIDGAILEGKHKPSSEWRMHAAIFEAFPEAGAVFHTHSPFATAFAVIREDIPVILIEMTPFLGGDIQCAGFESPGSRELGLSASEVFKKGRTGCLLESHGVLTYGKSLDEAYIRAEYVEEAALIYHHALQIGEPIILA